MFGSSKRRGKAREMSVSAQSKVQQAIDSVIEPLETRVMLSTTVTYQVQTTNDNTTDQVMSAGINLYKANTLRAAIDAANTQPFPVIIDLSKLPKNSTITLTSTSVHPAPTFVLGSPTLPAKPASHTWDFIGGNNVTISGAGKYQIFNVGYASNTEFDTLTLAHGTALEGGAIQAESALTLNGDSLASNVATYGGAVYVPDNTLVVTSTTFTSNSAEYGGAVYTEENIGAPIQTFTSSTFTGNTASEEGGAIYNIGYIPNGGLVVTSSTFNGNGATEDGGAIYSEQDSSTDNTSVTITKSTFTGNVSNDDDGGALYSDDTVVTLTTDTFSGNKAQDDEGGAIYSEDYSLIISGSTLSNNSADEYGGAIYFEGSGSTPLLSISSTSFTGNQALDDSGGAIYNEGTDNTTVSITGGSFTSNQAEDYGGAIYSDTGSTGVFTINGTAFSKNIAHDDDGGAITTYDATVSITNSTFSGDKASDDAGGGVYAEGFTTLTLSGDSFTNESSNGEGGAVYADGTYEFVTNSTFTGNESGDDEDGGAVYSDVSSLTVTGSTFNNNQATDEGGAIYVEASIVNISSSTFTGNQADFGGGAVYSDSDTVTITGSTFTNNAELNDESGGAVYSDDDLLLLDGDTFTGNSAGDEGGALYADDESTDIVGSTFANNTASEYGGAIYADVDELELFDSTINNNTATLYDGGGLYNDASTAFIANDTFYANSAGANYHGGAIYNDTDDTTITDTTIDANTAGVDDGGGIYNDFGDVILDGDIVALNSVTGTPGTSDDLAGTFDPTSTNNVIGDIGDPGVVTGFTAGLFGGNLVGTNANPINPLLAPLANNGGTTQTQALETGSPAINFSSDFPVVDNIFGLPTFNTDITQTDQAGTLRPSSGGYDSGSFQSIPGLDDHFVFVTPANATAGQSFPVTVEVFTDLNQPDNTFSEPVTITSSDAAATGLPGAGTLTFSGGLATFNPTLNTVGNQTFTITDTKVGTLTAPATSNPINVTKPVAAVTPSISINNPPPVNAPTSGSGTVPLTFTVTLSSASATTVTVDYQTQQGTASSGHGDYVGLPGGVLTFAPGQTSKTITVTVNKAKFPASTYGPPFTASHPGVYFYVLLYNAQNALLGSATGIGTLEY